ncbi:hypothetical protein PspLS_07357 [Pyricularia sp. CBS 133598]|nr:hypothetical protein PspLS_07357 [Pyricularia sp. CBS 133598]
MASLGGMWAPAAVRVLRQAVGSTVKISKVLRTKLGSAAHRPITQLPQPVTSAARHQPIHPFAFLRQQKRGFRWHSALRNAHYDAVRNTVRRFISGSTRVQPLQSGQTTRWVKQFTGRAPFASTLRPNLTGGAFPRTAGGYATPGSGRMGGARYFSHAPPVQAQVVQNVGQAMRAFWLSGQRAHFDGYGSRGEKCYRVTTELQDETARKAAAAAASRKRVPGSFIDFSVNPTITALSPLAGNFPFAMCGVNQSTAINGPTLNQDGLLDLLLTDFERAFKDLHAVMADLKRLSNLGDLPIVFENDAHLVRVRFPGVDADTVTRLCEDIGIQQGIVGQDEDFRTAQDYASDLRFPFAPDHGIPDHLSSPDGSLRSHQSYSSDLSTDLDDEYVEHFMEENPWLSSVDADEYDHSRLSLVSSTPDRRTNSQVQGFEGVEGIYRFIQECDRAAGRF